LSLIALRLTDRTTCSLETCLQKQPGRYVTQAPRQNDVERALLARGEKLHRHGDFLVHEVGPNTLRNALEVAEAEAIARCVQEANETIRRALSRPAQTFHPFELVRDARGTVTGLRRSATAVSTEYDLPREPGGPNLSYLVSELHPQLVGWWQGPGTFAPQMVLSERYRGFFEPLHAEVHRARRLEWQAQARGGFVMMGGREPVCDQKCEYRHPLAAGDLPPELFAPRPDCVVVLGGLHSSTLRLLRLRGERFRQAGPVLVLERRPGTVDSLLAATELETLVTRVISWNNKALMGHLGRGVREYEIRYGSAGDAEAIVLGERVVKATGELLDEGTGNRSAADVLGVLCPALRTDTWSGWELPSRYEPLVQEVRGRAERAKDPFVVR
jgi:hypothetical protein